MRVLTICHVKLRQSTALEEKGLTFGRCHAHSITFGYLLVLSIILFYIFSIKCSKLSGAFAQHPLLIDKLQVT